MHIDELTKIAKHLTRSAVCGVTKEQLLRTFKEMYNLSDNEIKALEERIKREEEGSKPLLGEELGDVKNKLPEIFGYPISFNKEMLKRLGFKDRDIITEDTVDHLSRRSDLLFNKDPPFPEYTLYGGIG